MKDALTIQGMHFTAAPDATILIGLVSKGSSLFIPGDRSPRIRAVFVKFFDLLFSLRCWWEPVAAGIVPALRNDIFHGH